MSNWTPEQRKAIDTRGTNLLVSAGAGSGKTAVLVERIVSMVVDSEKPIDIDRLLVVTFTNAAAAEMRERIGAALAKLHSESPDNERLIRQSLLLGKAPIMTLHSFCLDLLRQHFYMLDLDPAFRVADEHEAQLLREEAVEAVLEDNYTDPSDAFMNLIEGFTGKHDDREVRELILRLAAFADSSPDPNTWLSEAAGDFAGERMQDAMQSYCQELCSLVCAELLSAHDCLAEAVEVAQMQDGPAHYLERLYEEMQSVAAALAVSGEGWDILRQEVLKIAFGRLPSRKVTDQDLRDRCKGHRDEAKDIVGRKLASWLTQSTADFAHGMGLAAPVVHCLVESTLRFQKRYARLKREKSLMDFADLEHFCLQLLADVNGAASPVAEQLQQRFAEILTDEYQDINAVQERIIRSLTRGDNSFMVGDVKQSIYRFRLAEPSLFIQKSHTFREAVGGEAIDLSSNFRSRRHVIDSVNYLFSRIMTEEVGEVAYDADAALKTGATFPEHPQSAPAQAQLCLLDRRSSDADDDEEQPDAATAEARFLAGEIRQLVAMGENLVYDRRLGSYRPVQYRDIVVLLRATRGFVEVFVDHFGKQGIPAFADTAAGYFAATEITTMLSLLRVIDNPEQDIPLAAVLRSPLLGLSGEELSEIRVCEEGGSLFAALGERGLVDDALGTKLRGFLATLLKWRQTARRGSLPELIWRLYRETGYYVFVGATPGGMQRQANLRALYDRACQYERTSFRGLFRFLRFIERLQESEGDLGSAKVLGESEDVVRILSVHKSKGLEFPVVFVAGLGRRFNMGDQNRSVLIHRTLGLGPHVIELDSRQRYPTLPRIIIQGRLRREALAEEMRILYVAMTRAKEYLYLVGSLAGRENKVAEWRRTVRNLTVNKRILATARTPLDWIGPAVLPAIGDSPFALQLVGPEPAMRAAAVPCEANARPLPQEGAEDMSATSEISRALCWTYPGLAVSTLAAKTTVSELKGRSADVEADPGHDLLSQLKGAVLPATGGVEVGSAVHSLLQHADFTRGADIDYLRQLRDRLVSQNTIPESVAGGIDLQPLADFFSRALGGRLSGAEKVWREVPFSMMLPLQDVYPGQEGDEKVMLQGIVDCLFVQGEQLVLVDFKTDRSLRLLPAYRSQLDLYMRAVSRLFGRRVDEAYVAFVTLRQDIRIAASERGRAAGVNQSI